ncbi:phosphoglucosamine mutase 2 [Clostridium sp. CAG:230]|nr:phosphoglucosamine mutase 2 [Clostridium sp. CAG:230]
MLSYKEYDTINCCFFSRKNKRNQKRISENKLQGGTVMKYFGTDGFRGEANVDLNVVHAYKVGRFLGWYYGQEHKAKIVIGKDTRRSSYMFEDALSSGLTASGADVYLLHVTPTPSVSYVVRTEQFDCGIMISASHNPYYDNGLKVINGKGHKLEAEIEEKIEAYIDSKEDTIPFATKDAIGCTVDYAVGRHRYIGYLMSLATRSFKNVKVGLDCANGSSYSVAKGVFDALGATTFAIGMNPDGTNINRDCGSTHIENLQKYVRENNLDVGFAYDGDADRCLAVDDKGEVIDGDAILYLCGCYLKEKGELNENTIVTTIMSNLGLYKALDRQNIKYEKTAVGDKYVNANMTEHGYSLGGEQSGHIIFSKYAVTGDGVLTSLMLMEVMLEKKAKLSELRKDLKAYPQVLKNVRVADKPAARNDADVIAATKKVEEALGDNGRILLRESGTEPVIRVMVEADTKELCNRYVDDVIKVLEEKGHVVEK